MRTRSPSVSPSNGSAVRRQLPTGGPRQPSAVASGTFAAPATPTADLAEPADRMLRRNHRRRQAGSVKHAPPVPEFSRRTDAQARRDASGYWDAAGLHLRNHFAPEASSDPNTHAARTRTGRHEASV